MANKSARFPAGHPYQDFNEIAVRLEQADLKLLDAITKLPDLERARLRDYSAAMLEAKRRWEKMLLREYLSAERCNQRKSEAMKIAADYDMLPYLERRFRKGDREAAQDASLYCIDHNLPLPAWACDPVRRIIKQELRLTKRGKGAPQERRKQFAIDATRYEAVRIASALIAREGKKRGSDKFDRAATLLKDLPDLYCDGAGVRKSFYRFKNASDRDRYYQAPEFVLKGLLTLIGRRM